MEHCKIIFPNRHYLLGSIFILKAELVTWRYILDRHKTVLLWAIWVKNRRLQINDKLGIILIKKGPLGRKKRASVHPPLDSFNHSSLSPPFIGLKIFTLGTKFLYSLIKAIIFARSWKQGYCFMFHFCCQKEEWKVRKY